MTSDLMTLDVDPLDRLAARIRDRTATTAVVGLGYVGLPLLVGMHTAGFRVIGVDADEGKIDVLSARRSHIADIADSEIEAMDRASFSANPAPLADADVIVLCLPTPLTDGTPDLTMVLTAAEDVARTLRPGVLVVLESTTYPGTTEELLRPILEESGLVAGRDFALAYSPERIDPGNREHRLDTTPKVVAGLTDRCRELAGVVLLHVRAHHRDDVDAPRGRDGQADREHLPPGEHRARERAGGARPRPRRRHLGVAARRRDQAVRLPAVLAGPRGRAATASRSTPPTCRGAPASSSGYRVEFIEHANEVNNRMPDYVVSRVADALNDAGKPIKGSAVLGVGVAFKPGVDDLRESPSLLVLDRLARRGADVSFHDSFVPRCRDRRRGPRVGAARRRHRRASGHRGAAHPASRRRRARAREHRARSCSTLAGSRWASTRRTSCGSDPQAPRISRARRS